MTELQALLKYQETDGKLKKIEQEIYGSDERKKYSQARKFMEGAGEKLDALDARAVELKRVATVLTKKYLELNDVLKEMNSELDEEFPDGADMTFYERNAQGLSDGIKALKNDINALIEKIKAAQDEYQHLKSQTIKMQKQYSEYKERFGKMKENHAAETEKITAELTALEEGITKENLQRYKNKRKENIFPVFVPMKNDRCSMCGMDLPIALRSKLEGGGLIECDSCHRFIYSQPKED